MVRRSFRVGLRLGLLIGIGFALFKTMQSRRASSTAAVPPPEPWQPIVDTPRPAPPVRQPVPPPVDEVGEPIMEPPAPEPVPEVGARSASDQPTSRAARPHAAGPSAQSEAEDVVTASVEEDALIEDAELSVPASALDEIPDDLPPPAPVKKAAAKKAAAPAKKAAKAGKAAKAEKAEKAPTKKAAKKAAPAPAWVEPEGGTCPPTHPVKAKLASRLFHLPGMFAYDRTRPDRCFRDAEAAVSEGFTSAKR